MSETDNVIDGRSRFQREPGPARGSGSFEELLAQTARVPVTDRPILASNLGKLAERINPANPLAAAKQMVEHTGHEGLWQKRKRFIRLPCEEARPDNEPGAYGSSGRTYLRLAQAAGHLLATSKSPEAVERELERAIRAVVLGTSFLPTFTPLSKSDRAAKALLDEYESVLLSAIKGRTRIVDLWAVLRDSPVDLDGRSADEEPFEIAFGGAEQFPSSLLRPHFRDHIVEAIFKLGNGIGYGWEEPTVELGFVAIKLATEMFALPADVAPFFHASRENDDFSLCKEGVDWLGAIGRKGGHFPDCRFEKSVGYGWKPVTLSIMRKVGLSVDEGDDGQPKLKLNLWGSAWEEHCVAFGTYGLNGHVEDRIVQSGGRLSQLRLLDIDPEATDFVYAVYSHPVSDGTLDDAEVIGLLPEWWNFKSEFHSVSDMAWSDDPHSASLLLSGEHRFIPTIPACEPQAGALRSGSLGAALLNNALLAEPSENVANLLIEKAAVTADAGLRFHEAVVDRYREALRRI